MSRPYECEEHNPESFLCPDGISKCRGDTHYMFSIGLHFSTDLIKSANHETFRFEVQSAGDVTDISCLYTADPFLFHDSGDTWYLFTEAVNNDCQKGEIALSVSTDGLVSFQYSQIVLSEPWHLSWPFVLEYDGVHYMLPCATAGLPSPSEGRFLWLYQSSESNWPYRWERKRQILFDRLHLEGRPLDPVLFFHESGKTWYLMTLDDGISRERIYFSDRIDGGYVEHIQSKQYGWRQAGRIITDPANGLTWAFFQTGSDIGLTVTARRIEELSRLVFRYSEESFVVAGPTSQIHHAQGGMHTFDAHRIGSKWVAAVDGWFFDYDHLMWRCLAAREQNSHCWHQISSGEDIFSFRALRCNCSSFKLWESGQTAKASNTLILANLCPQMLSQATSLIASLLQRKHTVVEYGCSEWTLFYSSCVSRWWSIELESSKSTCNEVKGVKPDNVQIQPCFSDADNALPQAAPRNKFNFTTELSACGKAIKHMLSDILYTDAIFFDSYEGSQCVLEIVPFLPLETFVILQGRSLQQDWLDSSLQELLLVYRVAAQANGVIILKQQSQAHVVS